MVRQHMMHDARSIAMANDITIDGITYGYRRVTSLTDSVLVRVRVKESFFGNEIFTWTTVRVLKMATELLVGTQLHTNVRMSTALG